MIVDDAFLKKLRAAFDLNIYEVKIWTALLSRGVASAGELSDISNVPRSRSYDVLESLEKKGFIIMKLGKPIKYIAIKPEEILKRIKKNLKSNTEKQIEGLNQIKENHVFKEIELLYKQGIEHVDPTRLSGAIRGRENVYSHIESMLSGAKESVIVFTSADGFIRKVNAFRSQFKMILKLLLK